MISPFIKFYESFPARMWPHTLHSMPELHKSAVQTTASEWRRFRRSSLGARKLCSHPHHTTEPWRSFTSKARKGRCWSAAQLFTGLHIASTLVGSDSGKDFHSWRLINTIEIYLLAVTKLIAISTFLPNALLLMNGRDLGENMIVALDVLPLQIACNTVCSAEAAPLQE